MHARGEGSGEWFRLVGVSAVRFGFWRPAANDLCRGGAKWLTSFTHRSYPQAIELGLFSGSQTLE